MRIIVKADEFVWVSPGGAERSTKVLRAPESCIFEQFEVWRDGAVFDTGAILHIAEQGYDGFEGLEGLLGERRCLRSLEPGLFKPGDEIRIDLLRANVPEAEYWNGLVAVAAP